MAYIVHVLSVFFQTQPSRFGLPPGAHDDSDDDDDDDEDDEEEDDIQYSSLRRPHNPGKHQQIFIYNTARYGDPIIQVNINKYLYIIQLVTET
jgi:hypothetical protein